MGSAVCIECPNLHLPESLPAELRLTTEWLLGDEAVWADAAGVDFVFDEVAEFQHVDVANRRLLVEGFAGAAVIELRASVDRQSCLLELLIDVIHGSAIEDRRRERSAELLPCPAKKRLEDLPQVHSGRHTQRVQQDVHGRSIFEERHVLDRNDLGNDTLVSVAAGHLVAHLDFALARDIDLRKLHDARWELVTHLDLVLLPL